MKGEEISNDLPNTFHEKEAGISFPHEAANDAAKTAAMIITLPREIRMHLFITSFFSFQLFS